MGIEYTGNLLQDYEADLEKGYHLAIMPISRVEVEWFPRNYPAGITFYPVEFVDLNELGIVPNRNDSSSLAEAVSAASGVDRGIIDRHPLVVFPCTFDWFAFCRDGFRGHLEFIRTLSDYVDRTCLNFIRYCQCSLGLVDTLPGRAGMVNSNPMMAGALLYNHTLGEGRIIGGDAFTHRITKGLGLPIESIDHSRFPKKGQVGFIINHALALYTALLEAENQTLRFVQALSLLEFLAYPGEYRKFQHVKKIVARHVAQNPYEYRKILNRFLELTGKKNEITGQILGYRTRVIHMGQRVEDLLPDKEDRRALFTELENYIKAVMDHMIIHSDMSWQDYLTVRNSLRPFEH
jgi:hypothetical protein